MIYYVEYRDNIPIKFAEYEFFYDFEKNTTTQFNVGMLNTLGYDYFIIDDLKYIVIDTSYTSSNIYNTYKHKNFMTIVVNFKRTFNIQNIIK